MRKRIATKVKVDIKEIGMELQKKSERRKKVFAELCNNLRSTELISMEEAKSMLKKELAWKCMQHLNKSIG